MLDTNNNNWGSIQHRHRVTFDCSLRHYHHHTLRIIFVTVKISCLFVDTNIPDRSPGSHYQMYFNFILRNTRRSRFLPFCSTCPPSNRHIRWTGVQHTPVTLGLKSDQWWSWTEVHKINNLAIRFGFFVFVLVFIDENHTATSPRTTDIIPVGETALLLAPSAEFLWNANLAKIICSLEQPA